jgi:hypothetical protein
MLAGCTHAPVVELVRAPRAADRGCARALLLRLRRRIRGRDRAQDEPSRLAQPGTLRKARVRLRARRLPRRIAGRARRDRRADLSRRYAGLLHQAHVVRQPRWAPGACRRGAPRDRRGAPPRTLERLFAERGERIAALIVEPLVQCAAGMAMHDPALLALSCAPCATATSVHLIADEIAVGFGRTGTLLRLRAGRRLARLPVPVQGHQRWLPAPVRGPDARAIYDSFYSADIAGAPSCTRIPTPAIPWPAALRWPRWTSFATRTVLEATGRAAT